jgi:MarR family transcriptional regulator for hemolysin
VYASKIDAPSQDIRIALVQALLLGGRRWRARLNERLRAIGQTDCAALNEIAGCEHGVVQRELSQRLGVEEPTVVRLIDALESSGWVERRPHSLDRRAKVVQIKPEAREVLDGAQVLVADLQAELFGDIDPADMAVCVRVLNEISRKLERA